MVYYVNEDKTDNAATVHKDGLLARHRDSELSNRRGWTVVLWPAYFQEMKR